MLVSTNESKEKKIYEELGRKIRDLISQWLKTKVIMMKNIKSNQI